MATEFPENIQPNFVDQDQRVKDIFANSTTLFKNPITNLTILSTFIPNVIANLDAEIGALGGILSTLDAELPATTSPFSVDDIIANDIVPRLETFKTDLTTLQGVITLFLTHTNRLSGVTRIPLSPSVEESDIQVLFGIASAWASTSAGFEDFDNKVVRIFGSLYNGEDIIQGIFNSVVFLNNQVVVLSISQKIEDSALNAPIDSDPDQTQLGINIINTLDGIPPVSSQNSLITDSINNDKAQIGIALQFLRDASFAGNIFSFAKDEFTRFHFETVVGSQTLIDIFSTIETE